MMESVEKVAAAVLYEGYLLWPYRRSALKNQKRWNFGCVFPRMFSETAGTGDPWQMQTQCLVSGAAPSIAVKVKFLQAVERRVAERNQRGELAFAEHLQVGAERYVSWEEARERELAIDSLKLSELRVPRQFDITFSSGSEEVTLVADNGEAAGALVHIWRTLEGTMEVSSWQVQENLFRITVLISNITPWEGRDREGALKQSLLSTHTILQVDGGDFISLTDPPEDAQAAAQDCRNLHTWPVLAGTPGQTRYLLSSPIILPDYPQVAPESPGDLFDSAEIDQLLFLNILALTDEEKQEIRATDPRVRAILERTESLGLDDFMQLHGAIRDFRSLGDQMEVPPVFRTLEAAPPDRFMLEGTEIKKGSRVRLHPRPGGDIWDIALAGKVAFVEAIEQDYDGKIQLAVTVEDDPGRDLGEARLIGHRFYFSADEVVPISEDEKSDEEIVGKDKS